MHMGEIPDPMTQEVHRDLGMAKQTIDLLDLLKAKTAGNLDKAEDQLLTSILTDLRTRYVTKKS